MKKPKIGWEPITQHDNTHKVDIIRLITEKIHFSIFFEICINYEFSLEEKEDIESSRDSPNSQHLNYCYEPIIRVKMNITLILKNWKNIKQL